MGKVMITGASGQLGRCIRDEVGGCCTNNYYVFSDIVCEDSVMHLDLTGSIAEIYETVKDCDIIVNCAAYTNVNGCETDRKLSSELNVEAVKKLVGICKLFGKKLIHISTDYVFDGKKSKPYDENDCTHPINEYGKQKAQGEAAAFPPSIETSEIIVIRTSWLYSKYGKNFVKTMIDKISGTDPINVVYDQVGTPTYARDLARAIVDIIENDKFKRGIYQYSNEGVASWYDFTQAIKEYMADPKAKDRLIYPSRTDEGIGKTQRPSFSVMSKKKIKETFNLEIPYWRDSLKKCVMEIEEEKS